jgi:pimeloyl-ACP methyl ester carboxylesterase
MHSWTDVDFSARDGLRLYARHYPSEYAKCRPVLCLAGLTRNSADFHDLATALARERPVYALDSRGRGKSEHDANWKNYSLLVEVNDALDFATARGLHSAAVVGTSRGGLITMLMSVLRPGSVGVAVLNDIGPVIERDGLARIAGYVGRVPTPRTWPEATSLVQEMSRRHFPAVPDEQWSDVARAWFTEDKRGNPAPGYDSAIAKTFSPMDAKMPELWPQFASLTRIPVLALRGQHSDILSVQTLDEMRIRHPRFTAVTVAGQGHAPLLKDAPTIGAISQFLTETD